MDSQTSELLLNCGAKPMKIGFERVGLNPISDLIAFLRLIIVLRNHGYDYFFGYTVKPVIYGSAAALFAGVKNIYSLITGLGYAFVGRSLRQRFVGKIIKFLYRLSLQGCDGVLFQNRDDLADFKRMGLIDKQKVCVVNGSGVDIDWYKLVDLPTLPVRFLMIARLYREKGVSEFISAAKNIKALYPEVKFRLVGEPDGNPNSYNMLEVKGWVEQGLIEYFRNSNDVREHIKDSRVFVLPSYREGVPRSVLEAMAMGRPIITCNSPGCRETVVDGENGYLVPTKDEKTLTLSMIKMISEPERHAKMGLKSRKYVGEKFDVRNVTETMLKFMGI